MKLILLGSLEGANL